MQNVANFYRKEKFKEAKKFLVNWEAEEEYLEFFYEATMESFCAQGSFLEARKFLLDWELDDVYLEKLEAVRESYYKDLKIESDPTDAEVWEGETLLGNTPLDLKLLKGEHEITVKSEGRTSQTQSILLSEKEQTASFQLMYEIHFPGETSPCTVSTHKDWINKATFSANGKYAAILAKNELIICETANWNVLHSLSKHPSPFSTLGGVSFSPDQQFLVFTWYQSNR